MTPGEAQGASVNDSLQLYFALNEQVRPVAADGQQADTIPRKQRDAERSHAATRAPAWPDEARKSSATCIGRIRTPGEHCAMVVLLISRGDERSTPPAAAGPSSRLVEARSRRKTQPRRLHSSASPSLALNSSSRINASSSSGDCLTFEPAAVDPAPARLLEHALAEDDEPQPVQVGVLLAELGVVARRRERRAQRVVAVGRAERRGEAGRHRALERLQRTSGRGKRKARSGQSGARAGGGQGRPELDELPWHPAVVH